MNRCKNTEGCVGFVITNGCEAERPYQCVLYLGEEDDPTRRSQFRAVRFTFLYTHNYYSITNHCLTVSLLNSYLKNIRN